MEEKFINNQKIIKELEAGEVIFFDDREWYYAGILDGRPCLFPKMGWDLSRKQFLELYKRINESSEHKITYTSFKDIIDNF